MKFIDHFMIKGEDKKAIVLNTLKRVLIEQNYSDIEFIIDVVCPELIDILVSIDKRKIKIKEKLSCFVPWCV